MINIKAQVISNGTALMSIMTAASLENQLLLIISTLSGVISIIYTLINVYIALKEQRLDDAKELLEKELEKRKGINKNE